MFIVADSLYDMTPCFRFSHHRISALGVRDDIFNVRSECLTDTLGARRELMLVVSHKKFWSCIKLFKPGLEHDSVTKVGFMVKESRLQYAQV